MMGYVLHHAIVATSWDEEAIELAATRARNLGLTVLGPSAKAINGYRSLLICPDGSKEGWADSTEAANNRDEICAWFKELRYENGSSSLEWCEVAYGSDDQAANVTRSEWFTGAIMTTTPHPTDIHTPDEVVRLAREAGFAISEDARKYQPNCIVHTHHMVDEELQRFAALVRQQDEALLRQALEALEWVEPSGTTGNGGIHARQQSIARLKERLK
jgi:hypothetical protein